MTTQHPTTPKAPKDSKNTETAIEKEQQRETARSINRQANELLHQLAKPTDAHPAAAGAAAHTPLIASIVVDKWLDDLRKILVDRSEFKLADHVVSARVVIKMLERKREETAAERDRLREQVKTLLAALRPFAELLENPSEYRGKMTQSIVQVKDIRSANKAISSIEDNQ